MPIERLRRNSRKAIPSKVLYVRVSVDLHHWLTEMADSENRSLSAVVESILCGALSTCVRCGRRIHYRFGAWWDDDGNWPCPSGADPEAAHVPLGPEK